MLPTHLRQLGTGGPLPQCDGMITVGITGVQEGGNAGLQGKEWSLYGEELMP